MRRRRKRSSNRRVRLQFGHDTNAVDAANRKAELMASPKLQFGHDTNAVDAPPYSARQRSWIVASIRPRHQCRGCHIWHTTADGHLLSFNSATTPMPWMRCPGTPCPPGPGGFNSATTPMPWMHSWLQSPWASTTLRLQFGHDTNAVDATIQVTKETARQLLQFGHDTNAVDAAVARPAALRRAHASIRPRHQCRGCMVRVRMTSFADAASIRPRHQCRGCCRWGRTRLWWCRGFNSATTPMPWMHHLPPPTKYGLILLQFGHDTNAVDASMNPRVAAS